MKNTKLILQVSAGLIYLFATKSGVSAQGTSFELWPETDIWYKVTPVVRFSAFAAVTRYLESDTRDINLTFQGDYSFGNSKHQHKQTIKYSVKMKKFNQS